MNGQDDQTPQDDALQKRAASLFDDSVEGLDAHTRSRLNQGRQQALAAAEHRGVITSNWLPLGAAAAVAIVAVIMWTGNEQPGVLDTTDFTAPTMATDFEILLDADEFEMLEDLEFYSWIDLDETTPDADPEQHVG